MCRASLTWIICSARPVLSTRRCVARRGSILWQRKTICLKAHPAQYRRQFAVRGSVVFRICYSFFCFICMPIPQHSDHCVHNSPPKALSHVALLPQHRVRLHTQHNATQKQDLTKALIVDPPPQRSRRSR